MSLASWTERLKKIREQSARLFTTVWRRGGRIAWVIAATSIVMILPLLLEIEREASTIELEKLQIKDLKEKGYSDQQIQQMGLTQAPEPSVGLNAPPPLPIK